MNCSYFRVPNCFSAECSRAELAFLSRRARPPAAACRPRLVSPAGSPAAHSVQQCAPRLMRTLLELRGRVKLKMGLFFALPRARATPANGAEGHVRGGGQLDEDAPTDQAAAAHRMAVCLLKQTGNAPRPERKPEPGTQSKTRTTASLTPTVALKHHMTHYERNLGATDTLVSDPPVLTHLPPPNKQTRLGPPCALPPLSFWPSP